MMITIGSLIFMEKLYKIILVLESILGIKFTYLSEFEYVPVTKKYTLLAIDTAWSAHRS